MENFFGSSTGAPATGPGTGASFFNNFFGGPSSTPPVTTPANPTPPPVAPPSTPPKPPVNNTGIVSTTGVGNEFNDYTNQLQQLSTGSDQYAQYFQNQIQQEYQNNALAQQQAIASATAKTANAENINNAQQAATLYGIRAAAAANGQSRYTPAETQLQTAGANASFAYKYNQLDQQEKLAIAAANAARSKGDTQTLGQMVNYIKEAQAMKLQLANYQLAQQKFGFQQYQYLNPSAYQNAELGIQNARLGLSQQQLDLARGIGAPTTLSSGPISGFFNNIFGTNLGTTSRKIPAGGNDTSNAPGLSQTVNVNGHIYTLRSDGNYTLSQ